MLYQLPFVQLAEAHRAEFIDTGKFSWNTIASLNKAAWRTGKQVDLHTVMLLLPWHLPPQQEFSQIPWHEWLDNVVCRDSILNRLWFWKFFLQSGSWEFTFLHARMNPFSFAFSTGFRFPGCHLQQGLSFFVWRVRFDSCVLLSTMVVPSSRSVLGSLQHILLI